MLAKHFRTVLCCSTCRSPVRSERECHGILAGPRIRASGVGPSSTGYDAVGTIPAMRAGTSNEDSADRVGSAFRKAKGYDVAPVVAFLLRSTARRRTTRTGTGLEASRGRSTCLRRWCRWIATTATRAAPPVARESDRRHAGAIPCQHRLQCGHQVECVHRGGCVHRIPFVNTRLHDAIRGRGSASIRHLHAFDSAYPFDTVHPFDTLHEHDENRLTCARHDKVQR